MEEARKNKADVVEFRFDLFSSLPPVDEVKSIHKQKIITVRRVEDGGKFEGDEIERLSIFKKYSYLFDYADIEVYAGEEFFDLPCKIIESYHNFSKTPDFRELKDMIEGKRGDLFKIAVMGRDKKDVLTITKILCEYDGVIAFLMGEIFSFTRVLAVALGSPFIYCSASRAVAPGQLSVEEAKKVIEILGL
jgi:3-dehydroquinate dehydratase-1